MERYLADTSVWINFFNQKQAPSPHVEFLRQFLQDEREIYICPVIRQEILQGIRDDALFTKTKNLLNLFPMLENDILSVTDYAIDLFRSLRKQGITIRKSNDCLISSYALMNDLTLIHEDVDFTHIAKKFPLKLVKKIGIVKYPAGKKSSEK